MELQKYRYICAECGCVHEDKNGICIYGHDNWMELEGESILTSQVEVFEDHLKISISNVFKALTGDKKSLNEIYNAHKKWLIKNNIQIKQEDVI